jgi:hypothetical protein
MINDRKEKLFKLLGWLLTGEMKNSRQSTEDNENYEFRMLMRDQLKQLKDKGLPLRIMSV